MNYKYVYLGFLKDGKQEIQKVEFGQFWPNAFGLTDYTETLQNSIRETVLDDGNTYKTITFVSNISKDDAKKYYMMGDNLTNLGIEPNTVVGVSTKDGITLNNFNLTIGGNNTNTKPTCGPYKVKGNQLLSMSPIWNSAYLDKNNTTFQTFVNCDLPAGSFHGWFCHQVTPGTGADFVFLYLVSSNFWEEGEVPPFGDTTPGGTIGGYGTYDDTSDTYPTPPNILNDTYKSIFGTGAGLSVYALSNEEYHTFLTNIYNPTFFQTWENTIFNPTNGIYSCIRVPFTQTNLTLDNVSTVSISHTNFDMTTHRITNGFVYDEQIDDGHTEIYNVNEYFGSYLDYAPYTTAELIIPFYGSISLDINEIMGGSVKITRRCNYLNGDFTVFVQCTNRFGISNTHTYSGNAAFTLPIVSGDTGMLNKMLDAVAGVVNGLAGNVGGAISKTWDAFNEGGNVQENQRFSGGAGWMATRNFYLIIRRVCQSNPENYTKENGRQADEFVKFSDLQGYTEVAAVDLKFTNGKITPAEIDEINNLLKQGVFF